MQVLTSDERCLVGGERPRGPGLEALPALLAEAAEHSPDSVALFTSTGWAMRWANNSLRDRQGMVE